MRKVCIRTHFVKVLAIHFMIGHLRLVSYLQILGAIVIEYLSARRITDEFS